MQNFCQTTICCKKTVGQTLNMLYQLNGSRYQSGSVSYVAEVKHFQFDFKISLRTIFISERAIFAVNIDFYIENQQFGENFIELFC